MTPPHMTALRIQFTPVARDVDRLPLVAGGMAAYEQARKIYGSRLNEGEVE